jgi:hypothetical protein
VTGPASVRGRKKRLDDATLQFFPGGVIRVEGRILSRNVDGEFEQCLGRFHVGALTESLERIVVDVARLEWISESAVTALVAWVLAIQREPTEKRYEVVFRINSAIPWQHGTFMALRSVAPEVVGVESAMAL